LILDLNIHPSFGKDEGHFLKSLLAQTNWQMKWIDQVYNKYFCFVLFVKISLLKFHAHQNYIFHSYVENIYKKGFGSRPDI